jgi:hypothetical protein
MLLWTSVALEKFHPQLKASFAGSTRKLSSSVKGVKLQAGSWNLFPYSCITKHEAAVHNKQWWAGTWWGIGNPILTSLFHKEASNNDLYFHLTGGYPGYFMMALNEVLFLGTTGPRSVYSKYSRILRQVLPLCQGRGLRKLRVGFYLQKTDFPLTWELLQKSNTPLKTSKRSWLKSLKEIQQH